MTVTPFNRLETLDYLIRSKRTGTPAALAKRLGISRRTLFDFIDTMKYLGAPISYCKYRKSYYYTERGKFTLRFQKDDQTVRLQAKA